MRFEHLHLLALLGELRSIQGARLQKIAQPDVHSVALGLRRRQGMHWLLLSIHAQLCRVHLLEAEPGGEETPFTRLLRQSLRGALLRRVEQIQFDRILHLVFQGEDRWGQPTFWSLIGEFMGKHSNLTLVDRQGCIVAPLKPVSHRINRHRELLPGRDYLPPPPDRRRDPFHLSEEQWEKWWAEIAPEQRLAEAWGQAFRGGGSFFWQALARAADLPPDLTGRDVSPDTQTRLHLGLDRLLAFREGAFQAVRSGEGEEGLVLLLPRGEPLRDGEVPLGSLSEGLRQWADLQSRHALLEQRRGEVRAALKRLQGRLQGLEREGRQARDQAGRAAQYRHWGELLLAHASALPRTGAEVTVPEYLTGEPVTIPLFPGHTPLESADRYFALARKAEQGHAYWRGRWERIASACAECEGWMAAVSVAGTLEELETIARAMADLAGRHGLALPNLLQRGEQPAGRREEGLGRHLLGGKWEVLFGRNAQQNDQLLSQAARPDDLWFHARGTGGSHLILRTGGQPERVPQSVIQAAAQLAAWHSQGRHSALVPVDYALRKYVHKSKGAGPGQVTYRREKTLFVEPRPPGALEG